MNELSFSKFDKQELEKNNNLKIEIADLYAGIFSAPDWNEEWNRESACSELEEVVEKEGFTGLVVKKENKVIGFSWGYNFSKKNSSRVLFEKIRGELESKNIPLDSTFYGADTGVDSSYRLQGIASKLLAERTKLTENMNYVCFRTKSENMLKIYRKTFGDELFSFPEESSYEGGRVYVFRVEK